MITGVITGVIKGVITVLVYLFNIVVRVHYTTKEVSVVTLGVIEEGMIFENILRLKGVNS
ncbi:MAG: hypothetical protein D3916_08045 [Candidatus Electrothrix sp. MAN1_4]|nr:hypothetical protein [Candidatus Electrothrix sp. MAN1_4]